MKLTLNYNTVCAFATQRNATQRNAYHHYLLNNNFKFYIAQFFRAVNFLIVFIRFAKNQFAIISHCHYEGVARSNPNLIKFDFYNLISLINKFYTKWIATPSLRSARNDKFNYIHAFSYALKNKFEIISRNENYAFDYNKYFCRNGNNRIVSSLRGFAKNRSNPIFLDCHADKSARTLCAPNGDDEFDGDGLFSRNDYGGKVYFRFLE